MSSRINTNVSALQAASNLDANSNALSMNIEQLSSGLRINSAADDPAGYAISNNFKAQISGLSTATSNANDAINEVKTAEGALTQVQNLLISMRQLAVNASNLGTNSTVDLQADQSQINSAIQSINQIATTTSFGDKYLLNGSATSAVSTAAGTTTGTGITVAAQGLFNSGDAGTYTNIAVTAATNATDAFTYSGGTLAGQAGEDGSYTGSLIINGTQYNLSSGSVSDLADLNSTIASSGYQASIDGAGNLVFTDQASGSIATPSSINLTNLNVGTSSAVNTTSTVDAGTTGTVTMSFANTLDTTLSDNTIGAGGASLVLSLNGANKTVSATAGETLSSLNTALNSLGVTLAATASSLTLTGKGSIGVSSFTGVVANSQASTSIGTTASNTNKNFTIALTGTALGGNASDYTLSTTASVTWVDAAATKTATASIGETLANFLADFTTADANATASISGGNLIVSSGSAATLTFGSSAGGTVLDTGETDTTYTAASGVAGGAEFTENSSGDGGNTLTAAALLAGSLTVTGASGAVQTLSLSAGSTLAQLNTSLAGAGITASVDAAGDLIFASVGSLTAPTVTLGGDFSAYQSLSTSNPTGLFSNGDNAVLTLSNATSTLTSVGVQASGNTNYFNFANGMVLATTQTGPTIVGNVTATAGATSTGQTLEFQIGANSGQTTSVNIGSVAANELGTGAGSYVDANGTTQTVDTDSIADLNLMTFKGAQDAIQVIDQAINQVSTLSANLGSFQTNVLQSNVTSLGVASQNLQASLSTIEDTDLSTAIVDYTKNSILVQAGTSALSYANQAPQAILKLLQ